MVNSNRLKFYSSLFGVTETQRKIAECGDEIASVCSSASDCHSECSRGSSVVGAGKGRGRKVGGKEVKVLLYGLEAIILVDEKLKEQGEEGGVREQAAKNMTDGLFSSAGSVEKAEDICAILLKKAQVLRVTASLESCITTHVIKRTQLRVSQAPDPYLLAVSQLRHLPYPHQAVPAILQSLTSPHTRREILSLKAAFSPVSISRKAETSQSQQQPQQTQQQGRASAQSHAPAKSHACG